jgi:hypothetical protein
MVESFSFTKKEAYLKIRKFDKKKVALIGYPIDTDKIERLFDISLSQINLYAKSLIKLQV